MKKIKELKSFSKVKNWKRRAVCNVKKVKKLKSLSKVTGVWFVEQDWSELQTESFRVTILSLYEMNRKTSIVVIYFRGKVGGCKDEKK